MTILELNHIAIHVADVEKSCQFYEKVLRLGRMKRPAFNFPGAWFRLGAHQELHLIGGRTEPANNHDRGSHFALMVDDMDAWETHFTAIGASYLPRRKRPDGAFQIYVTDPDRYYIELCTRVPEEV